MESWQLEGAKDTPTFKDAQAKWRLLVCLKWIIYVPYIIQLMTETFKGIQLSLFQINGMKVPLKFWQNQ